MTKIRRRWLLASAILAVLLAGAFAIWAWYVGTSLRTTDAKKVVKGMTRDEVIAILGDRIRYESIIFPQISWEACDGYIRVRMDIDGRVASAEGIKQGEPFELFLRRSWTKVFVSEPDYIRD